MMTALPPLGFPPVRAPRDPVSPADEDDDEEDDHEVDPMIGRRRHGATGGGFASVDIGLEEDETDEHGGSSSSSSLQDRLVQVMSSWPPSKLRRVSPIHVATELGISVEDAAAELCRLMSAVGTTDNTSSTDGQEEEGPMGGATFSFVRIPRQQQPSPEPPIDGKSVVSAASARPIPDHVTMIFSFPKDFQVRARRNRRRSELADLLRDLGIFLFKLVKIVTALGLFVSLLIVTVVAALAALAALVALSRQGFSSNDATTGRHLRQHFRAICDMCRNGLWCYAVFMPVGGAGGGNGPNDPFLRELAADLSLLCSCLRGNWLSMLYWVQFRRHRVRHLQQEPYPGMVRVGRWGTRDDEDDRDGGRGTSLSAAVGERGLLSVAAEFLFGPTPFSPGPSPAERWRLRARFIVDKCAASPPGGAAAVSLADLAPFVDSPPSSIQDSQQVVAQGMVLVAHFRGVPSLSTATTSSFDSTDVRGSPQSTFVFPELMAESAHLSGSLSSIHGSDVVEAPWTKCLLYESEPPSMPSRMGRTLSATPTSAKVPSSLVELPYRLTRLTQRQFALCAFLVTINGLGVLWLRQSICGGAAMSAAASRTPFSGYALCHGAVPVLHFYSIVFVALPVGRLALIVLWNANLQRRNVRRRNLAREVES